MKVKEVMRKKIYTISPEEKLKAVVDKLLKYVASGLVVVDGNNEVVGIVSEKDVYRTLYPSYREYFENPELFENFEKLESEINHKADNLVRDFMTTNVVKVSAEDPVMKVGSMMLSHNIHRFPVVDQNQKLIGVVTRGDIFRSLFKKYLKPQSKLKKLWPKNKLAGKK